MYLFFSSTKYEQTDFLETEHHRSVEAFLIKVAAVEDILIIEGDDE